MRQPTILRFSRRNLVYGPASFGFQSRTAATQMNQKRAGNISDAFASLSRTNVSFLDPRYKSLKKRLIAGHEEAFAAAWVRLLARLQDEITHVKSQGNSIVPEISYDDIKDLIYPSPENSRGSSNSNSSNSNSSKRNNSSNSQALEKFASAYRRHGVAVIRNVLPSEEALGLKSQLREYIHDNRSHSTGGFPAGTEPPQVFELYWSRAQVVARAHVRLRRAHGFLLSFWRTGCCSEADHGCDGGGGRIGPMSVRHSITYADRLRLRQPGDASFALGPHVDGGSVERWEEDGYGRAAEGRGTYEKIWQGRWEEHDPWDLSLRIGVQSDLYGGVGACSCFRAAQGWLSLSNTGPGEGHLLVNPLLKLGVTYWLMRPFFEAKNGLDKIGVERYLKPENWQLEEETSSKLHGAFPGHGQEVGSDLHPHLRLEETMVHMPQVNPGDFVVWHCDTIHAVDKIHNGTEDSSVLYIPVCPLTDDNVRYLGRQRDAFIKGIPSPDFGGGEGESKHDGRPSIENIHTMIDAEGLRAMGLLEWDSSVSGLTKSEKEMLDRANKELGFYY